MRLALWGRIAPVALLAILLSAPLFAATCHTEGPDLSAANSTVVEFQYAGWLQTFIPTDTLLAQVTVWRANLPDTLVGSFFRLYVGGIDSTGTPDLAHPIAGPFDALPSFSTTGPPIPLIYPLSPPVHLVAGRSYYFALDDPYRVFVSLLTDSTDSAAPGHAWKWKFPGLPIQSGGIEASVHAGDLIYQLELCDDAVPAVTSTWGALKARYH